MSEEKPTNAGTSSTAKSVIRIAFIVISSAAYYSLAVLGWGGLAPFWTHPALLALAVSTGLLVLVSLFAGGNLSSGVREDRGNRWVLTAFMFIGLLDGFLPAYTDRHDFWTIDGETTRWVGIVLFVVGGALRIWPVYVLGNRFSGLVAIQPGHTLVTGGVYGVIRHPSYLGMLITALGWGLAFRAGAGVLLALLNLWPLIARIRAEERLLRSQFGDEYSAYCARTSRLIPGLY